MHETRIDRRRALRALRALWPLAVLLLYALAFQGSRGLFEPDEGRYTDVALEMLRSGDFLHPHLHPERPHYSKPPLTYWAIAGSAAVLGRDEWAARLPNALAFAATVLLVAGLARRLVPAAPPWWAALIYATSLLPFVAAATVSTDTLLTLWETLAVYGFAASWRSEDPRRAGRFRLLMWGAFGLAFLTKGPPGLLPLLAIVPFAALARGRSGLRRLLSVGSLALFAAVAFWWFAAVIASRPGLLGYFLRFEVADRLFTPVHHRNSEWYGGLVVYLPTLLVGSLPWSAPLVRGLRRLPALARPSAWRRRLAAEPEAAFLLLWLLVPLALFFVARSRLPFYLLPLFVPLSLLLAREAAGSGGRAPLFEPARPRHRALLAVWVAFLIGLKLVSAHVERPEDSRRLARILDAAVRRPFDEVVFVDLQPRYGLALYTGAEVEEIFLRPGSAPPNPLAPAQGLAEELAEPEARVWVVRDGDRGRFEAAAAELGYRAVARGGDGEVRFFVLEAGPGAPALANGAR